MKNFSYLFCLAFGFCLLLTNVTYGQEKRVNVLAPIESVDYTLSSGILKIEVKLREAPNTDSVSSTPLSKFELLPLIVTNEKNISGESRKDNNPDRNSMTFTYRIEVLQNTGDDVFGNLLRLQPTWGKFSFVIPYSFRIASVSGTDGPSREFKSPSFSVYRSLIPAREADLVVKMPTWSVVRSGQDSKTDYLAVPLQAKTDIRVQVNLRDNVKDIIVATGKELLRQNDLQSVVLKLDQGQEIVADRNYTIEISSLNPDIKIAQASQKTNWTQARSTILYKVEETAKNDQELQKLNKVISPENALGITISTTKVGSLKMVFDDASMPPITGTYGSTHNFTIDLKGKAAGTYPFHFEGTGQDNDQLISQKKYSITIDPKTRLDGLIEFEVDEQNNLVVRYSLNRNVSKTSLVFRELQGSYSVEATPIQGSEKRYQAALNLNAASDLIKKLKENLQKPENAQKPQVPIKFFVTVENPDRLSEEIGSFSLLAFRINQTKLLEALNTQLDAQKATKVAIDVLGYKTTPASGSAEEAAVNYLVEILQKKNGDGGKKKFMSFLKFAGKVAGGYFGIPVPF